jgi:hypothetical protein
MITHIAVLNVCLAVLQTTMRQVLLAAAVLCGVTLLVAGELNLAS